jgi:hypothetical protein
MVQPTLRNGLQTEPPDLVPSLFVMGVRHGGTYRRTLTAQLSPQT